VPIRLNATERQARKLLVNVAKGEINETRFLGLIGYKEFWERISDEQWGQGKRGEIVDIITRISAYELERHRPPLNEIVVRASGDKKGEPGEEWQSIRNHLHTEFGVPLPPYASHAEAQRACWDFWGRQVARPATATEVEEGEPEDRTVRFRKRNASIIQECKKRDNYTCKACSFRLKVGKNYIIDCHHRYPLGRNTNVVITNINDLVCLCPTCHRVAHTRRPLPLWIEEIRAARSL
jgi:hypothetical protein